MPGIIVGVDGSGHSERALEWAMKEAAVRHAPLTVLTVHQAVHGWSGAEYFPDDAELTEKARAAAQAETDKVLARLGDARPESVTVTAVHGFPVEELVKASEDADLLVVGQRGLTGFQWTVMGSVTFQVAQHARCPVTITPSEHQHKG